MLALALGSTVQWLQANMPQTEFADWIEFYRLYPFDDRYRYHRPAALVATSMNGAPFQDHVDLLQRSPSPHGYSQADLNTLKAFGISPQQRKIARGIDVLRLCSPPRGHRGDVLRRQG